jgi:hypothetical protein
MYVQVPRFSGEDLEGKSSIDSIIYMMLVEIYSSQFSKDTRAEFEVIPFVEVTYTP